MQPGEAKTYTVIIGVTEDADEIRKVAADYATSAQVNKALQKTQNYLSLIHISIPIGMILINLYEAGAFDTLVWCVREVVNDFNNFRKVGGEKK